jgi:hypothetical protein
MPQRREGRIRRTEGHHERPPDPVEASDRPLEDKSRHPEPGGDPHDVLNHPVGEPDPTSDSDPYEDAEDSDEADDEGAPPAA